MGGNIQKTKSGRPPYEAIASKNRKDPRKKGKSAERESQRSSGEGVQCPAKWESKTKNYKNPGQKERGASKKQGGVEGKHQEKLGHLEDVQTKQKTIFPAPWTRGNGREIAAKKTKWQV